MTARASFSYCLLQYEHNPWLRERLNIGVLLLCEQHRFLKLRTRSWDGRITSAYPTLDKSSFTEDLWQIERSIIRYERTEFKQPSFFTTNSDSLMREKSTNSAEMIATIVAPSCDSSYRWTTGGVGYCISADKKLIELFERFVTPYEAEKKRPNRSDEQVWSGVSKLLLERKIADQIEAEPIIHTDLGRIKFQAGYQNGSYHVIQPLSFDLADEEYIGAKAAKWGGYAQSLKGTRRKEVTAQFVLGSPCKAELMSSFKSATRYLKNLVGSENVYEERQREKLVDRISDELASH